MTADFTQELIGILREHGLHGSRREISAADSVESLGLDSLALMTFLTAVEKRFSIEIPDNFWSDKGTTSLGTLAGIVSDLSERNARNGAHDRKASGEGEPIGRARRDALPRRLAKIVRPLSSRVEFAILYRDLLATPIPEHRAIFPLQYTHATLGDLPRLSQLWPPEKTERKMRRFQERLNAGYTGLLAWHGEEAVGMDWLSSTGDFEPITGVQIGVSTGTIYGFDLHEKYPASGVGFALLCRSLHVARDLGFSKQVTLVSRKNTKMLTASIRLLGFEGIGEIVTRRIGRHPFTAWRVRESAGRGRAITL
jgi:acyl carrier protein